MKVTFDDVAGIDEAKRLLEIIQFLSNLRKKFFGWGKKLKGLCW